MAESGRDISWGIEQRLEFIEFRLFWEGGINRSALRQQFGISIPQASNDLRRYAEQAPGNLVYDKSLKRYFASPTFAPKFFVPDADQYLNRLRSAAVQRTAQIDAWFSQIPAAESMPLPHRRVEVEVLRRLLDSIRGGRSLQVLYQSMNPKRPEALWRWISPHAFANDGLRWHVRAFCHLERKFKDFLLPRCLETGEDGPLGASSDLDRNWKEFFNVVLVPNPKLSRNQQNVVAQDYCMEDRKVSIPVRKSFLYYFQKRLRLDVAYILDNPRETPVIVENEDAFNSAVAEADK
jgi:hypothetical protein